MFNRTAAYNAKGQLASDASFTVKSDGKTYSSDTTYAYGTGSAYALGAVVSQTATSSVSGTSGSTSATTTTDYVWYDGAQQSRIGYVDGTTSGNTYLGYDGASRLRVAEIQDGKPRYVDYVSDELGQVVYRREIGSVSGQTGGPHEVTYRFGGRQLGFTGNNGTTELSVDASIADRQQVTPANQGTFRNKQVTGGAYTDFAQSYDALNSYQQGSTPGGYTVQAGDTLQGIAYQVWGDGALWYKLAEANGLSMASPLIAGMQLTLPAGVVRTGYNAATMRPYDPADALGNVVPDTSPTPAPAARKKSNKCGVFGAILLAVVAVAVAVAVGPGAIGAAQGLLGGGTVAAGTLAAGSAAAIGGAVLGGAAAGALASIASQAVGVATGIQEKFSFKGVALAALSGGVGGGLGASGLFGRTVDGAFKAGSLGIGSRVVDGAVSGLAGNIATQGVAIATGLQGKFDWAGVAVAGVVGGTVGAVNVRGLPAVFNRTLAGTAGAITGSAARSLIDGSSFGDNVIAALPQVIGSTIGELVAGAIVGRGQQDAPAQYASSRTVRLPFLGSPFLAGGSSSEFEVTVPDVVVVGPRRGESLFDRIVNAASSLLDGGWSLANRLSDRLTTTINAAASRVAEAASIGAGYRSVAPAIGKGYLATARANSYDPRPAFQAYSRWAAVPVSGPIPRNAMSYFPGGEESAAIMYTLGYDTNPARLSYNAPITRGEVADVVLAASGLVGEVGAIARGGIAAETIGPRVVSPRGFVELDEFSRLNVLDPAIGKLRPGEASAAVELQRVLGGQLERLTGASGADFKFVSGPQAGKSVDFLLTPGTVKEAAGINRFFAKNADRFSDQLGLHLGKADIVPIDSRFLTPQNQRVLMDIVGRQSAANQSRVIIFR